MAADFQKPFASRRPGRQKILKGPYIQSSQCSSEHQLPRLSCCGSQSITHEYKPGSKEDNNSQAFEEIVEDHRKLFTVSNGAANRESMLSSSSTILPRLSQQPIVTVETADQSGWTTVHQEVTYDIPSGINSDDYDGAARFSSTRLSYPRRSVCCKHTGMNPQAEGCNAKCPFLRSRLSNVTIPAKCNCLHDRQSYSPSVRPMEREPWCLPVPDLNFEGMNDLDNKRNTNGRTSVSFIVEPTEAKIRPAGSDRAKRSIRFKEPLDDRIRSLSEQAPVQSDDCSISSASAFITRRKSNEPLSRTDEVTASSSYTALDITNVMLTRGTHPRDLTTHPAEELSNVFANSYMDSEACEVEGGSSRSEKLTPNVESKFSSATNESITKPGENDASEKMEVRLEHVSNDTVSVENGGVFERFKNDESESLSRLVPSTLLTASQQINAVHSDQPPHAVEAPALIHPASHVTDLSPELSPGEVSVKWSVLGAKLPPVAQKSPADTPGTVSLLQTRTDEQQLCARRLSKIVSGEKRNTTSSVESKTPKEQKMLVDMKSLFLPAKSQTESQGRFSQSSFHHPPRYSAESIQTPRRRSITDHPTDRRKRYEQHRQQKSVRQTQHTGKTGVLRKSEKSVSSNHKPDRVNVEKHRPNSRPTHQMMEPELKFQNPESEREQDDAEKLHRPLDRKVGGSETLSREVLVKRLEGMKETSHRGIAAQETNKLNVDRELKKPTESRNHGLFVRNKHMPHASERDRGGAHEKPNPTFTATNREVTRTLSSTHESCDKPANDDTENRLTFPPLSHAEMDVPITPRSEPQECVAFHTSFENVRPLLPCAPIVSHSMLFDDVGSPSFSDHLVAQSSSFNTTCFQTVGATEHKHLDISSPAQQRTTHTEHNVPLEQEYFCVLSDVQPFTYSAEFTGPTYTGRPSVVHQGVNVVQPVLSDTMTALYISTTSERSTSHYEQQCELAPGKIADAPMQQDLPCRQSTSPPSAYEVEEGDIWTKSDAATESRSMSISSQNQQIVTSNRQPSSYPDASSMTAAGTLVHSSLLCELGGVVEVGTPVPDHFTPPMAFTSRKSDHHTALRDTEYTEPGPLMSRHTGEHSSALSDPKMSHSALYDIGHTELLPATKRHTETISLIDGTVESTCTARYVSLIETDEADASKSPRGRATSHTYCASFHTPHPYAVATSHLMYPADNDSAPPEELSPPTVPPAPGSLEACVLPADDEPCTVSQFLSCTHRGTSAADQNPFSDRGSSGQWTGPIHIRLTPVVNDDSTISRTISGIHAASLQSYSHLQKQNALETGNLTKVPTEHKVTFELPTSFHSAIEADKEHLSIKSDVVTNSTLVGSDSQNHETIENNRLQSLDMDASLESGTRAYDNLNYVRDTTGRFDSERTVPTHSAFSVDGTSQKPNYHVIHADLECEGSVFPRSFHMPDSFFALSGSSMKRFAVLSNRSPELDPAHEDLTQVSSQAIRTVSDGPMALHVSHEETDADATSIGQREKDTLQNSCVSIEPPILHAVTISHSMFLTDNEAPTLGDHSCPPLPPLPKVAGTCVSSAENESHTFVLLPSSSQQQTTHGEQPNLLDCGSSRGPVVAHQFTQHAEFAVPTHTERISVTKRDHIIPHMSFTDSRIALDGQVSSTQSMPDLLNQDELITDISGLAPGVLDFSADHQALPTDAYDAYEGKRSTDPDEAIDSNLVNRGSGNKDTIASHTLLPHPFDPSIEMGTKMHCHPSVVYRGSGTLRAGPTIRTNHISTVDDAGQKPSYSGMQRDTEYGESSSCRFPYILGLHSSLSDPRTRCSAIPCSRYDELDSLAQQGAGRTSSFDRTDKNGHVTVQLSCAKTDGAVTTERGPSVGNALITGFASVHHPLPHAAAFRPAMLTEYNESPPFEIHTPPHPSVLPTSSVTWECVPPDNEMLRTAVQFSSHTLQPTSQIGQITLAGGCSDGLADSQQLAQGEECAEPTHMWPSSMTDQDLKLYQTTFISPLVVATTQATSVQTSPDPQRQCELTAAELLVALDGRIFLAGHPDNRSSTNEANNRTILVKSDEVVHSMLARNDSINHGIVTSNLPRCYPFAAASTDSGLAYDHSGIAHEANSVLEVDSSVSTFPDSPISDAYHKPGIHTIHSGIKCDGLNSRTSPHSSASELTISEPKVNRSTYSSSGQAKLHPASEHCTEASSTISRSSVNIVDKVHANTMRKTLLDVFTACYRCPTVSSKRKLERAHRLNDFSEYEAEFGLKLTSVTPLVHARQSDLSSRVLCDRSTADFVDKCSDDSLSTILETKPIQTHSFRGMRVRKKSLSLNSITPFYPRTRTTTVAPTICTEETVSDQLLMNVLKDSCSHKLIESDVAVKKHSLDEPTVCVSHRTQPCVTITLQNPCPYYLEKHCIPPRLATISVVPSPNCSCTYSTNQTISIRTCYNCVKVLDDSTLCQPTEHGACFLETEGTSVPVKVFEPTSSIERAPSNHLIGRSSTCSPKRRPPSTPVIDSFLPAPVLPEDESDAHMNVSPTGAHINTLLQNEAEKKNSLGTHRFTSGGVYHTTGLLSLSKALESIASEQNVSIMTPQEMSPDASERLNPLSQSLATDSLELEMTNSPGYRAQASPVSIGSFGSLELSQHVKLSEWVDGKSDADLTFRGVDDTQLALPVFSQHGDMKYDRTGRLVSDLECAGCGGACQLIPWNFSTEKDRGHTRSCHRQDRTFCCGHSATCPLQPCRRSFPIHLLNKAPRVDKMQYGCRSEHSGGKQRHRHVRVQHASKCTVYRAPCFNAQTYLITSVPVTLQRNSQQIGRSTRRKCHQHCKCRPCVTCIKGQPS